MSIDKAALDPTIAPAPSPTEAVLLSPSELPSASPTVAATEAIKTPEETIRYYFDHWIAKDSAGMESVTDKKAIHNGPYDFDILVSLQLLECKQVQTLSDAQLARFQELGYKDSYEKSVVGVVYEIEYTSENDSIHGPGKNKIKWSYSLVRETNSSDWKIIAFGY